MHEKGHRCACNVNPEKPVQIRLKIQWIVQTEHSHKVQLHIVACVRQDGSVLSWTAHRTQSALKGTIQQVQWDITINTITVYSHQANAKAISSVDIYDLHQTMVKIKEKFAFTFTLADCEYFLQVLL